jgi:hypothetical protein
MLSEATPKLKLWCQHENTQRDASSQHTVSINSELSHIAALERKGQDLEGGTEIEKEKGRHCTVEKWAWKERD